MFDDVEVEGQQRVEIGDDRRDAVLAGDLLRLLRVDVAERLDRIEVGQLLVGLDVADADAGADDADLEAAGHAAPPGRAACRRCAVACACAFSAISMAWKQCFCGMAVSVRSSTSSRSCSP